MISSPPRMEIQQSMRRNSSSFYHASATTLFANHGDFFNTHACYQQLSAASVNCRNFHEVRPYLLVHPYREDA